MTGDQATCDRALHQAIQQPFQEPRRRQETPRGFDSSARIKTIGRTEIVFWTVEWRLPGGNSGTLSVPLIVKAESHLESVLREYLDPVSLPMAAVIDGAPAARSDTLQHETGVRFPHLSPANVTQPVEGVRESMIRTTDLDRAKFCPGRFRVLLEPLSAVPLEISPVVLP